MIALKIFIWPLCETFKINGTAIQLTSIKTFKTLTVKQLLVLPSINKQEKYF